MAGKGRGGTVGGWRFVGRGRQAGSKRVGCTMGRRSCPSCLDVQCREHTVCPLAIGHSRQAGRRRQQAAHPPPVALVHHGHPLRHLAVAKRAFVHPAPLPAALTTNQGLRRRPAAPANSLSFSSAGGRRSLRGASHLALGRPAGNVRRCRGSAPALQRWLSQSQLITAGRAAAAQSVSLGGVQQSSSCLQCWLTVAAAPR